MPSAYVLVNCEIGAEEAVLRELKKIEKVTEAYAVYGVYDIIAKVEADTMEKVKGIITQKIRGLKKIRSTITMIITEPTV